MRLLAQPGGAVWVADAPNWQNLPKRDCLTLGISTGSLQAKAGRGQSVLLGQLYGIVATGLIHTKFIFQGLKRDMRLIGSSHDAASKFAFSWLPNRDAYLDGDRSNPHLAFCGAPANRVFVVYVSPNGRPQDFPEIDGWLEHWTWIASDPEKIGAPVDWVERYDTCIWESA